MPTKKKKRPGAFTEPASKQKDEQMQRNANPNAATDNRKNKGFLPAADALCSFALRFFLFRSVCPVQGHSLPRLFFVMVVVVGGRRRRGRRKKETNGIWNKDFTTFFFASYSFPSLSIFLFLSLSFHSILLCSILPFPNPISPFFYIFYSPFKQQNPGGE